MILKNFLKNGGNVNFAFNKFRMLKKFSNLNSVKFPKISKDQRSLMRLDKISIFEYFNITEERKVSLPEEYLVKEIVDYFLSPDFNREFKYTFSNEEKKFKFLILNICLLVSRLEKVVVVDTNNNGEENKNAENSIVKVFDNLQNILINSKKKLHKAKLTFLFKYLPLKFYCKEVVKFYISKNQINSHYTTNFILENEFLKKFNKKDFKFLKIRKQFIDDLTTFNKQEDIDFEEDKFVEKIKEKYIIKFLLDGKGNPIEAEKLALYLIAHVNIIKYNKFIQPYFLPLLNRIITWPH